MKHIRKVWENTSTGQLFVTVPKESSIQKGDYVTIEKVK